MITTLANSGTGFCLRRIILAIIVLPVILMIGGCASHPAQDRDREFLESQSFTGPEPVTAWNKLAHYKGRDLTKLPLRDQWKVHELVDRASPFVWRPIFISDMRQKNAQEEKLDVYTIILERCIEPTNASCLLRARAFTLDGIPRSSAYCEIVCGRPPGGFNAPVGIKSIEIVHTKNGDLLLIRMGGGPAPGKQYYAGKYPKQYYALDADALRLVRIEDESGKLIRNGPFRSPYPDQIIGGFSGYYAEQMEWILKEGTLFQKLAALQWLYGQSEPGDYAEPMIKAAAFKKTLQELSESDDVWLREQASLVLKLAQ